MLVKLPNVKEKVVFFVVFPLCIISHRVSFHKSVKKNCGIVMSRALERPQCVIDMHAFCKQEKALIKILIGTYSDFLRRYIFVDRGNSISSAP